ncbi:MAG TPA: arylformamidase [Acidobacteriota bacterium]|jgi:arylformamidase|nr:arylformamidase [Acidobacteriota bacterium]
MKIYDISPLLHPGIAVWPGDTPFSRTELMRLSDGESINLSSVTLSLHTGAHADAPSHFLSGGTPIDQVDLHLYVGPARIVTLHVAQCVDAEDLQEILRSKPERLLIRVNPNIDPDYFPEKCVHLSPRAATRIGMAGVKLIGTDAPSVDPVDSKDLPAHHALARYGTAILENLNLRQVPDGDYELIALPLKIAGGDASPVRAILREME